MPGNQPVGLMEPTVTRIKKPTPRLVLIFIILFHSSGFFSIATSHAQEKEPPAKILIYIANPSSEYSWLSEEVVSSFSAVLEQKGVSLVSRQVADAVLKEQQFSQN